MDVKGLTELVSQYEYGQFNILEKEMKIRYNSRRQEIILNPFYDYGSLSNKGSCAELMNTAYFDILKRYPNYHVLRVTGYDPNFFRHAPAMHCFLLICEKDLMSGKPVTYEEKEIKDVTSSDPLIFDPSFHKVVPFSESSYGVIRLVNQGVKVSYSNRLISQNESGAPLSKDSEGNLVNMMVDFETRSKVCIGVQEPGKEIQGYHLYSKELGLRYDKDPGILRFIDFFRRKEIKREYLRLDSKETLMG